MLAEFKLLETPPIRRWRYFVPPPSNGGAEVNFIVSSLEEITNVIIPLFDKHPVRDGKYRSFLVFKKVVEMMNQKEHTTLQGFMTILELSYLTHNTTNRTLESKQEILTNLKNKFQVLPSISEEFLLNSLENSSSAIPLDKEFVRGLVDGDGSFNFSFRVRIRLKADSEII
jgi:hypothetical protein